MFTVIINILLSITSLYLAYGLLFAFAFVIKGAARVDEGASGATVGFRIIIFPASVIFWPVLLRKWVRATKKKTDD